MKAFATNHPVTLVFILIIAWFVSLVVFTSVASSALRVPYGGTISGTIGRLAVTACVLFLLWRLGWLEPSGVSRPGSRTVWLLALGGMIYFAGASLYSFYGRAGFDFSSLTRFPESFPIVTASLAAGLSEEILFRGLALYALVRVWGNSTRGIIRSVVFTSLLFAVLHMTQVFTHGASLPSVLLLTLQTCIISVWWGALVVLGGSIWPAVMLHFVVNAAVSLQGLTVPMVEPDILAYRLISWFSIPLGALGIWFLTRARHRHVVPEAP